MNPSRITLLSLPSLLISWAVAFTSHEYFLNVNRYSHPPPTSKTRYPFVLNALSEPESPDKTLYEILGAKGTETKAELKQLYTALAKRHHPDAEQRSRSIDSVSFRPTNTSTAVTVDFSEIAAAYKTLSDPKQRKRYDRSLQAAQFSKDVQRWADAFGRQAAPAVNQVLDQVAVPFLRRTTATTLAGIQAVSKDLASSSRSRRTNLSSAANGTNVTGTEQSTGSADLLSTFEKAMAAAKRAGKYVDSIELIEKSQELEQRAEQTRQEALLVDDTRKQITERRIHLSIHTPQSGLSSTDALSCMADMNETTRFDELTMMDRLLLRNTVQDEIENLQKAENEFLESQEADKAAQAEYQRVFQQQVKLQLDLKQAKAAEAEARLALQRAIEQVAETKASLGRVADSMSFAKAEVEASSTKMERKSHFLLTQSERVRRHLVRKEKTVHEMRGTEIQTEAAADDSKNALQEIERLKDEERMLASKHDQLEATCARLLSRASVLKERAQAWKET